MPLDIKQYLEPLKELSQIDRRLRLVVKELEKIPVELETSGAEYLTLSQAIQEREIKLEAMNKERLSLEEELKTLMEEALEREKRLYAIKTQKEYQATLKEIAKIKQENKTRENRVLSLLEEGEKNVKETTQLKSEIADKEGDYKKMEEALNKKKEELLNEKKDLTERRPKLLSGLPEAVLGKYDLVRKRFLDPIAAIRRGVCQGCSMNIPPQVYNEMLKGNDFRHCPNCHRLIYAEV